MFTQLLLYVYIHFNLIQFNLTVTISRRIEIVSTIDENWNDDYRNKDFILYKSLQKAVLKENKYLFKKPKEIRPAFINEFRKISQTKIEAVAIYEAKEESDSCGPNIGFIIKDYEKIPNISIRRLDCCNSDILGEDEYKGVYKYNATKGGGTKFLPCKYNSGTFFQRTCKEGMVFEKDKWMEPALYKCEAKYDLTKELEKLSKAEVCDVSIYQVKCIDIDQAAKDLKEITSSSVIKVWQDVASISYTVQNIVKSLNTDNKNQTIYVLDNILSTYNTLMEVSASILGKSQIEESITTSLLKYLDEFTSKLAKIFNTTTLTSTITIKKPNMALTMAYIEQYDVEVLAKSRAADGLSSVSLIIGETKRHDLRDELDVLVLIQIPKETLFSSKEVISSFFYKNSSLFLTGDDLKRTMGEEVKNKEIIQSNIFAVSINSKNIKNLEKPIILTFKKVFHKHMEGQNICTFWSFNMSAGIDGIFGGWSPNGCKVSNSKKTKGYVTCECDHLTNFALLLDVSQTENNPLELKIVTFIGCGISIFCLIATIITLSLFRKLRQNKTKKLLLCLCMSLLLLLIVFVTGAEQTSSRFVCQLIAGLIHYLQLTTFFWMFIEAIYLYRSVIMVYNKDGVPNFLLKSSILSFGLPAIIVVTSALIQPKNYGNDNFCVVRGNTLYFGVLLPFGTILVVNFVILILVMKELAASFKKRGTQRIGMNYTTVRITFTFNILLGTTWVFGLMALKDAMVLFQWLFCIFNSLQGFFIFIFYILRSSEVLNEWRRLFGKDRNYPIPMQ